MCEQVLRDFITDMDPRHHAGGITAESALDGRPWNSVAILCAAIRRRPQLVEDLLTRAKDLDGRHRVYNAAASALASEQVPPGRMARVLSVVERMGDDGLRPARDYALQQLCMYTVKVHACACLCPTRVCLQQQWGGRRDESQCRKSVGIILYRLSISDNNKCPENTSMSCWRGPGRVRCCNFLD